MPPEVRRPRDARARRRIARYARRSVARGEYKNHPSVAKKVQFVLSSLINYYVEVSQKDRVPRESPSTQAVRECSPHPPCEAHLGIPRDGSRRIHPCRALLLRPALRAAPSRDGRSIARPAQALGSGVTPHAPLDLGHLSPRPEPPAGLGLLPSRVQQQHRRPGEVLVLADTGGSREAWPREVGAPQLPGRANDVPHRAYCLGPGAGCSDTRGGALREEQVRAARCCRDRAGLPADVAARFHAAP